MDSPHKLLVRDIKQVDLCKNIWPEKAGPIFYEYKEFNKKKKLKKEK